MRDPDATTVKLSLPSCLQNVNETTADDVGQVLGNYRRSVLAIDPIQGIGWNLERDRTPDEQCCNGCD